MPTTLPKRRSPYADRLHAHSTFVFSDHTAPLHRGQWRPSFFSPRIGPSYDHRLVLEIGCNDASLLTTLASQHPHTSFVGLDWKAKALHDAATRIASLNLPNLALLRARAQDLPLLFADNELDEIWIFHPDPCARPDELKHRLLSEPFLLDAHATLRSPASPLCLKTDHPGYYQWACFLFNLPCPEWFTTPTPTSPKLRPRDLTPPTLLPPPNDRLLNLFRVTCHSPNYWHDPGAQSHTAPRPFAPHTTPYESRFLKKRHPIYYLELRSRP